MQLKQSVHLKYCVANTASHLFDANVLKHFQTKPFGSMDEIFPKNELKKLLINKNNVTVLLEENIKCFINIMCMYGHVFYYDKDFMKGYWDEKLPKIVDQIGVTDTAEPLELIHAMLGSIQKMINNLLERVGNCITNYCWVYYKQKKH